MPIFLSAFLIAAVASRVQASSPLPTPPGVTLALAPWPEQDYGPQPRSEWDTFYSVRITNGGETPIGVRHAGFWPNHVVILRDASGKELPLTKRGIAFRKGTMEDYLNRDHNELFTLRVGEVSDGGSNLNLQAMYAPKPGTYSLTVEYLEHEWPAMRVVSNPVPVVVSD